MPMPMYCPGKTKIRRTYPNGKRYVACDTCFSDITEPNDPFADRTGGWSDLHESQA